MVFVFKRSVIMKKNRGSFVVAIAALLAWPLVHAQLPAAEIEAAQTSFSTHSCSGCHDAAMRVVGPGLQEITQRYKGKKVQAELAVRIRLGSEGRWGSTPHPAYEAMTSKEATLLAKWILAGAP